MSRITMDMTLDEIRDIVLQLPPQELLTLAEEIEDRAQTTNMMKLGETAFTEWDEEGEDIYDAKA